MEQPKPVQAQTLAKYLVVYPVINKDILLLLQVMTDYVKKEVSGVEMQFPSYPHITLCPPFQATYEDASKVNLSISIGELNLNFTDFRLGRLGFFHNEGTDVLYLEVLCDRRIKSYITRMRAGLRNDIDLHFVGKNHDTDGEPKPHIHICSGYGLSKNESIRRFVETYNNRYEEERNKGGGMRFGRLISCVFARYSDGWRHLSEDPTQ